MIDLLPHVFFATIVMLVTIVAFDAFVQHLQGDLLWRIPLTNSQTIGHLFVLYTACGVGYWYGWMIGAGLPFSRPDEPLVIGCVFSAMATMVARGYHMMHFHQVRNDKYEEN